MKVRIKVLAKGFLRLPALAFGLFSDRIWKRASLTHEWRCYWSLFCGPAEGAVAGLDAPGDGAELEQSGAVLVGAGEVAQLGSGR
jgi:hypothetical protein